MQLLKEKIHELIESKRDEVFGSYPIAFDGVVDEARYQNLVFLLKEINGEEITYKNGEKVVKRMSSDWVTYTDWLFSQATPNNGRMYKTWHNACLWIESFFDSECSYMGCMDEYRRFDSRLRENLAKVAIVNIKKTPGGGGSDYSEIQNYAQMPQNAELIREEIDILEPQLVICGGTFDFAKIIWNIKDDSVDYLPTGTAYFVLDNRMFLDFIHPMWFNVNRNILFSYAKEVFAEAKKILKQLK